MSEILRIQQKSSTYTVVPNDNGTVLDCTVTLTLNLTSALIVRSGFNFWIWNTGNGAITVTPYSTELIDNGTSLTISAGTKCRIVCDGTVFRSDSYTQNSSTSSNPFAIYNTKVTMGGF